MNDQIETGLARLAKGLYQDVHRECIAAIQRQANDPVPFFLLAQLAADHQNYKKAAELFSKAQDLAPDNAYCAVYLAQILTQLGQQTEAKSMADHASTLDLTSAHLNDTLGVIYSRTGFHEKAIECFKKAVALNKKPANYHYNLAASLQFMGDFEAAKTSYQAALTRNPDDYRALASLVSLNKHDKSNHQLVALQTLFEQQSNDADAALHLGHAIAKTYEDLGDFDNSFTWLERAKAGKLEQDRLFDFAEIFAAAKQTSTISETNISEPSIGEHRPSASQPSADSSDEAPIFIVGLPRTGTTLVDRILSSHPSVVAAGELNTFAGLIKQASQSPSNLMMDAPTLLAAKELDLPEIGQRYIDETQELRRDAPRFTDKMPLNFFYAGLIHRALPKAKIVVLRRGAMDSCLSNYRQLLTAQHSYYNYTYSLTATAHFYRGFDDLMHHWRATLPSTCFMEVHYEQIVHDQEQQTRNLLEFCGLSWHEDCLNFHQNAAPVSTASSVQVRQPLYSGSIGRWKRYGDKLDQLRAALGNLAVDV